MSQNSKVAYTQGHHESITRAHAIRTPENSAAFLLPHIRRDARILDIGCGPGSITAGFSKYVPDGSVVGIDVTEAVLEQARAYAKDAKHVSFQLGNIVDGIPFPDDSFDVVYCHQVLIHLVDHVAALKEMRRLCKAGGVVACREGDMATFIFHPVNKGSQLYIDRYRKMIQHNGMEPSTGRYLHVWARQAGFDPKTIMKSASVTVFATDEERDFYAKVITDRFTQSDLRTKFMEVGVSSEEIQEIIDGFQAWKDDVDGYHGIMQGEIICTK